MVMEIESAKPTGKPPIATSTVEGHNNETAEDIKIDPIDINTDNAETSKMNEGVEVILEGNNQTAVIGPPSSQDQNVFRAPNPVRPRAVRAQGSEGGAPRTDSYGYGGAHGDYGYPAPSYARSRSFEDGGYPPATSHYSPHVQYPPPGRHSGDVNVISPNHKDHRPPMTPRNHGHQSYHYPPTSPVSRPGGQGHSPSRMRNYGMRRPEGPYSAAQRSRSMPVGRQPDGSWNAYTSPDRSRPPIVAESSFDSEHYSSHATNVSNPNTPNAPHYGPPMHRDPHYGFYGEGSFGGSFDSHHPPHHHRYYRDSYGHPPESPYSPYSYHGYPQGGHYDHYSPYHEYGRPRHPYDEDYRDHPNHVSPNKKDSSGMMLPQAAQEVDFEVTDPPMEPATPPSTSPVCESPADVNSFDVLCGRGGGTNSQVGNRRFRKLVQEFQPTYLLARRKEKPLLARTIVLIIRKRGGRFLKKDDETGELYEVGDAKAEAKTSQALREGLDVRATKSAASNLLDKKKKKKKDAEAAAANEEVKEGEIQESPKPKERNTQEAPPSLPRLNEDKPPQPRSSSPESMQFRKRRRMRSGDAGDPTHASVGCGMGFQDKLFPDFCPPRADLGRAASPIFNNMPSPMDLSNTPTRSNQRMEDDDDIYMDGAAPSQQRQGCAGIALDVITGAATQSFCLGPRKWR